MDHELNYIEINKKAWNNRTAIHIESDFYNVNGFLKGESSLNDIELKLLGDIKGKSILHLQCHFGQDTISLQRMGANVTGVDFSDKAIESANKLAAQTKSDIKFICCDIYDLPQHLNQHFDVVFTSYGTIGWLPDIEKWAAIVSTFLKSCGKFVFAEFHPVVWMFDNDFTKVEYNYFNAEAIVETISGTYADKEAAITEKTIGWNHAIGDVVTALLKNNLEINSFQEFDYSPYNCFHETEEFAPKKYRIKHLQNKIPMVYALSATKK